MISDSFIPIYITQKNVNVKQKMKKEIKFFRSNPFYYDRNKKHIFYCALTYKLT